jgi:hypothetical protein
MEYLYKERQRFNQWWLWLILIGINVISIVVSWNNISAHGLTLANSIRIVITLLLLLCFFSLRLETKINEQGIEVRFFPFHLSFIKISWKEIASVEVRKYSPIGEYGGWGIKYGFSKAGKAYNVSGNKGIQLVLNDGSRLLIGTNKEEEVAKVLKELQR